MSYFNGAGAFGALSLEAAEKRVVDCYTLIWNDFTARGQKNPMTAFVCTPGNQDARNDRANFLLKYFNPQSISGWLGNTVKAYFLYTAAEKSAKSDQAILDCVVDNMQKLLFGAYSSVMRQEQPTRLSQLNADARVTVNREADWFQSIVDNVQSIYSKAVAMYNQSQSSGFGTSAASSGNGFDLFGTPSASSSGVEASSHFDLGFSGPEKNKAASVETRPVDIDLSDQRLTPPSFEGPDYSRERPWDVFRMKDEIWWHIDVTEKFPCRGETLKNLGCIRPAYDYFKNSLYVVDNNGNLRYELMSNEASRRYIHLGVLSRLGGTASDSPLEFDRASGQLKTDAAPFMEWVKRRETVVKQTSEVSMLDVIELDESFTQVDQVIHAARCTTLGNEGQVVLGQVACPFIDARDHTVCVRTMLTDLTDAASIAALVKSFAQYRPTFNVALARFIEGTIVSVLDSLLKARVAYDAHLPNLESVKSMIAAIDTGFTPQWRNEFYMAAMYNIKARLNPATIKETSVFLEDYTSIDSDVLLDKHRALVENTIVLVTRIAALQVPLSFQNIGLDIPDSYVLLPNEHKFTALARRLAEVDAEQHYILLSDGVIIQVMFDSAENLTFCRQYQSIF